jgi:hypothetical protein
VTSAQSNVESGSRPWIESRVGRLVSFVAITWSIAGGFLLLQVGLPELIDFAAKKGFIPDSLLLQPPRAAGVDCAPAIQRARASVVDPQVAAQARFLVWRMGFHTGFAAGIASATAGSPSPVDPAPRLAEQPHQIAGLVGVDPPTLPAIQHAANALSEFQTFVTQGAGCVAAQLADKYSPREAALFQYGLVVGHAAVYLINAPTIDPLFVPEVRFYGREAQVPAELSQPFIDNTLNSLPGDGPQQKVQFALGRIEEFLKPHP